MIFPLLFRFVGLRLSLSLIALVSAQEVFAQYPAYDFSAVSAQLADNISLYGPGLSATVEQNGVPIFSYQAGLITAETTVGIASSSKWLSGAIVIILAERGYFSLDDRIGNFIPALEAAGKGAPTIRQCFAMTSGLYLSDPEYETDRTLTLAQSVDLIIANTPVIFPAGTQLAYDGDGMQVVGRICEIVTGKSWTTLASELLFTPLEMTSSHYDAFGLNPCIAGGVRSTANDYLKFLRMLLRNGVAPDGTIIMSSQSVEIFFANQTQGLPEYYSPWLPSAYFVYGNRPDYGLGSWIFAQPAPGATVEEVCSPGAFGAFPWIDRKRGLAGIFLTAEIHGWSETENNNLHAIALMRQEIDVKGLPDPGPDSALSIQSVAPDYVRLDWTGSGVLEKSSDLAAWTQLPLVHAPYVENVRQTTQQKVFFRLRR